MLVDFLGVHEFLVLEKILNIQFLTVLKVPVRAEEEIKQAIRETFLPAEMFLSLLPRSESRLNPHSVPLMCSALYKISTFLFFVCTCVSVVAPLIMVKQWKYEQIYQGFLLFVDPNT